MNFENALNVWHYQMLASVILAKYKENKFKLSGPS